MRLVKEGFGSWADVMAMPLEDAMNAFDYVRFQQDYTETASELNKPPDV